MNRRLLSACVQRSSIVSVVLVSGCSIFLPANPNSYQVSGEKVVVTFEHNVTSASAVGSLCPKPAGPEAKFAPLGAAVIPFVADIAVRQLTAELKDEAARYTAEYVAIGVDDKFYECQGPAAPINLQTISLRRTVSDEPAFDLKLLVEPSVDKTVFRLVPVEATMSKAKAKVARRRWYLPWTWGSGREAVDVDVEVTIEAASVNPDGSFQNQSIANMKIPLRNLALNQGATTGKPLLEGSGWFPAVPKSRIGTGDDQSFGNGNYVVTFKVREYDDIGSRVESWSEKVDSNRETIVKRVSEVVKAPASTPSK